VECDNATCLPWLGADKHLGTFLERSPIEPQAQPLPRLGFSICFAIKCASARATIFITRAVKFDPCADWKEPTNGGVHGSLIDNALLRRHSYPGVAERVISGALPFLPNRVLLKRDFFIGQAADKLVDLMLSAEVLSSNANRARTSFRSLNMMAASQSWASISL
jgi:hypothetical protein